jgi:hypothetical protein
MEKSNDSDDETVIEPVKLPKKRDGRSKERTEKQKAAFAIMAEKRKLLKETKDKEVSKPKKKVIKKQPESDSSSSSEDERLPMKQKSKRATTVYNYYYGPQSVEEKSYKRSKSDDAPIPLAPVSLPPPPPPPQVVFKKSGLTFV